MIRVDVESTFEPISGSGKGANSQKEVRITQLGGVVLVILVAIIIDFIFMGSSFKTVWSLLGIGALVFLWRNGLIVKE